MSPLETVVKKYNNNNNNSKFQSTLKSIKKRCCRRKNPHIKILKPKNIDKNKLSLTWFGGSFRGIAWRSRVIVSLCGISCWSRVRGCKRTCWWLILTGSSLFLLLNWFLNCTNCCFKMRSFPLKQKTLVRKIVLTRQKTSGRLI